MLTWRSTLFLACILVAACRPAPAPSAAKPQRLAADTAGGLTIAALAAVDPATLPLKTIADVRYLGSFVVPADDGAGSTGGTQHQLAYGGHALGLASDGSLYFGCHDWHDKLARISVPAIGGVASVLDACRDVAPGIYNEPSAINGMVLGGTLELGGRFFVGANSYYGNNAQPWSLWTGSSLSAMRGPIAIGVGLNQRTIGGYMGVVPPDFRAAFGGDAISGRCCSSIISNSSYGPALYVWDSASVESTKAATWLLGYPDAHQTIGTYNDAGGLLGYGMGTSIGGVFMVPNSNTTIFFGQQGTRVCYGQGTSDPSLDGKPTGSGHIYCHDPFSPYQGNHGYPYKVVAWFYRTSDLLDVKRGVRQPWDLKPYAISELPAGIATAASIVSATADPSTGKVYLTMDAGAAPRVHVLQVALTTSTGPDCKPGTESMVSDDAASVACVPTAPGASTGTKTVTEIWTRTGDVPAGPGGAACVPVVSPRTRIDSCTVTATSALVVTTACKTFGLAVGLAPDPVPPAGSGWAVRFQRQLAGGAWANHGSLVTAAPFVRTATVAAGAWRVQAFWTKTGAVDVPIAGPIDVASTCQ